MEKIALVTDTTCDLSDEVVQQYGIRLLPFRIHYKNNEYMDRFEITAQEVYDNFQIEIPKSSTPTLKDIGEVLTEVEQAGYTHCIFITLSSGLSAVYDSINLVCKDHPQIKTFVFDSKSISVGEGYLVEQCAQLIEKGVSFDNIIHDLKRIRSKMKLYFVVQTLEYLIKGGRIGRVSGTLGELLNIKPVITIDENDGKYITYAKARGRKQSLDKILEIGEELTHKSKQRIYVMSGSAHEEALKLVDRLKTLPNITGVTYGGNISPVAGVHSGPGLVGVLFVEHN